ncbi:alpha/beta fold hydrolase [Nitrosomonas ureae]|uniref:Lysophospholipase, alpha-beta hydrolase superfamily n=1 Tax=Nitrosomonas ureae TaxID=44577 RepID=A0A1H9FY76_9PROT|nr:alpha/beta fold hydrolase [Nitrosomonas ureae]SEQ42759.1 Lysophospholipase, alpha-beta hydrolase superfamily [Nitrosomonas ureae]
MQLSTRVERQTVPEQTIRGYGHVMILIGIFLFLPLSGCVHQKFVSEPYPRWGKEVHVNQSESDGPLLLRMFSPANSVQATACVLLVHGMNEHIGRYGEVAQYFVRKFIVVGFDHYAHGLSNPVLQQADSALASGSGEQQVGDAYLAQSPLKNLEPLRRNLDRALRETIALCDVESESERPVFIIAHSLGALVTASYLMQLRDENALLKRVRGIVFLAPAFAVSEPPGWRGWMANPLIKLSFHAETHFLHPQNEPLPALIFNQVVALVTVPILDSLFEMASWPGLRSFLSPVSPEWVQDYLTDSEEEKARLRADGWIVRRTLLRFVKGIEAEIVSFRRHMKEFSTPYYLVYSEQDPITPAWGSRDFARATLQSHPDNEVLIFSNLQYHQHLFLKEPARSELLMNIVQWMEQRMQATK